MGELFGEVLKLCDRAGLVEPGVVSIDGTRIAGNASPEVNHGFDRIAREILAEAGAIDEAEDELYGEARADELPEQLRTSEGRREFLRQARQRLRRDAADAEALGEKPEAPAAEDVPLEFDAERIVGAISRGPRQDQPPRFERQPRRRPGAQGVTPASRQRSCHGAPVPPSARCWDGREGVAGPQPAAPVA